MEGIAEFDGGYAVRTTGDLNVSAYAYDGRKLWAVPSSPDLPKRYITFQTVEGTTRAIRLYDGWRFSYDFEPLSGEFMRRVTEKEAAWPPIP